MNPSRRLVFLAAAFGLLLVPLLASAAGGMVTGSGTPATQRRDVGAFSGVALGAPVSVVLRPASREGVEIVADDNLVALIETTVRGAGSNRSLQIELARNARIDPRTPIVVTIDYIHLDEISVGGNGRVSGSGLKTGKLEAAIGGSGQIRLAGLEASELNVAIGGSGSFSADGRARKVEIAIGGSGGCDVERVAASEVEVSIGGSGSARVDAAVSLAVSIAGSGDVFHRGAAAPNTSIVGSRRARKL